MAKKKNVKRASLTRRQFLETMVTGAIAVPLVATGPMEAKAQNSIVAMQRQYSFNMFLHVPRIYNNSSSLGSRRYQRQRVSGKMFLGFDQQGNLVDVQFKDLVNMTHKLSNGSHVTYDACLDEDACYPRFNAIGDNKKNKFAIASICFALAAEPSYNIGEFDEDTSLYATLAGKGTIDSKGQLKRVSGYVTGTLGCGCKAYGHVSPTRTIGYSGATQVVTDVAAIYGTWTMSLDA